MPSKSSQRQESDLPKLAQPAQRALAAARIHRLEQLTQVSEAEVRQWHGIGLDATDQLRRALKAKGLTFAPGIGKPGKVVRNQGKRVG